MYAKKTQLLTHLQKQRSKCAKKKEIIHLEPQKYLVFLSIISSSKFFLSHLLALIPLRLCPMLHSYLGLSQRRSVCVEVYSAQCGNFRNFLSPLFRKNFVKSKDLREIITLSTLLQCKLFSRIFFKWE